MIDLRLGRWQDVLFSSALEVDCLMTDPPYGARTHEGWNDGEEQVRDVTGQSTRLALDYAHFTPDDVASLVSAWAPLVRGWMGFMTSHDLVVPYIDALTAAGRYAFAPVPIIQKRPRLVGDGPSSWTVYLVLARPRSVEFSRSGCRPGAYWYEAPTARDGVAGGKPLSLMRELLRHYTKKGDVVCDPFSGAGTTALAAREMGRSFVGAEVDPAHHAIAMARLGRGHGWAVVPHRRTLSGQHNATFGRRFLFADMG